MSPYGDQFGGDNEIPAARAFDLIASSLRPSRILITPTGVFPAARSRNCSTCSLVQPCPLLLLDVVSAIACSPVDGCCLRPRYPSTTYVAQRDTTPLSSCLPRASLAPADREQISGRQAADLVVMPGNATRLRLLHALHRGGVVAATGATIGHTSPGAARKIRAGPRTCTRRKSVRLPRG